MNVWLNLGVLKSKVVTLVGLECSFLQLCSLLGFVWAGWAVHLTVDFSRNGVWFKILSVAVYQVSKGAYLVQQVYKV